MPGSLGQVARRRITHLKKGIVMPARSARRSRPARLLTAITAFTLVATLASPAGATFPSHNGDIAFRRFLNEDRTWGAVFTVHPDGSGERQVTHPPEGFVDRDPDVSPDGRSIVFQREGELSSEILTYAAGAYRRGEKISDPAMIDRLQKQLHRAATGGSPA